jgi:hypothetical protein
MAATVASMVKTSPRGARLHTGYFVPDNSYPTTGYAITANLFGLTVLNILLLTPSINGLVPVHDFINSKVKMLWVDTTVDGAPLAEVTNGTNLSNIAYACPFIAIGT